MTNSSSASTVSARLARFAFGALAACALVFLFGVAPAFAETIPELSGDAEKVPRSGVPVSVTVTLDQPTTREEALNAIYEYRQEAYDAGYITLAEGTTVEEYVYGVTWNEDLERIAVQRAIEYSMNRNTKHIRPNGKTADDAVSNGVQKVTEGLAGLGSVYEDDLEYIELVRATYGIERGMAIWGSDSGHYALIIDPQYTQYGMACVGVLGSDWITYAVETGRGTSETSDESVGYVGACTATVYACDNDRFTVDLHPYCYDGAVKIGGTSQIKMTATSSFGYTNSPFWAIDPATAGYESSDPSVLTVDEKGVVTGVSEGIATVTVSMGDEKAKVKVPVTSQKAAFRVYNPNSGEHFYTLDPEEHEGLVAAGWYPEGLGWVASSDESVPVYRLYNPYAGDHHYTMDAAERDALVAGGWSDEGVGWYSDPSKGVVLYREYNPYAPACNHNYTTDKAEHDGLIELGWVDEGTAWYGVSLYELPDPTESDTLTENSADSELAAA